MKRMLALAGYSRFANSEDFGGGAKAALVQFQAAEGLPQTGALDQTTFAALKNVETRIRGHQLDGSDDFQGQGQKSAAAMKDQKLLRSLGYQVDRTDGVFDSETAQAVLAFRRDDKVMHRDVAEISKGLNAALGSDVNALNHDGWRVRTQESRGQLSADSATAAAARAFNADGTEGIGAGSSGTAVKDVQARLVAAGFDPKGVDGKWDTRTQTALRAFQKHVGLPVTGRVDAKTWGRLSKSYVNTKDAFSPQQSLDERDGAVARTERALRADGYHVRTDGLFDRGTERAVKDFERRHHLKVDGAVGKGEFNAIRDDARPHPSGQVGSIYRDNEGKASAARITGGVGGVMSEVKAHWNTIQRLAKSADLPPGLVAGIWYRESSFDEHTYLQNGDPLGYPTTHVPRGIYFGKNQFVQAATAALNDFKWLKSELKLHYNSTDKGAIATFAEYYNGLGYRSHGRSSPYVYAGTNQYHGGMYVADGVFSPGTWDQRLGVLAVANAVSRRYHVD